MGFFSGIRRRIKKIIPKEIRPAIPFLAAMIPGGPLAGNLAKFGGNAFLKAAAARAATDDEADLRDILTTGTIAAAPSALGEGLGVFADKNTGALAEMAKKSSDYIKNTGGEGLTGIKKVGGQAALDFGIKQAELNEKALEEYNASLLSRGMKDKASRRSAIFSIFVNNGYDEDEVNVMLDKYGYADGGKVMAKASMSGGLDKYYDMLEKLKKKKKKRVEKSEGGKIDPRAAGFVATMTDKFVEQGMTLEEAKDAALRIAEEEFEDTSERDEDIRNIGSNLQSAVGGLETAFGQPLGGRRLEPMRIIPGFASGGDVDEVMETEEEIITPDYLMKEEGVEIGEQVSAPSGMDELNQLSLMLFKKPLGDLTEDEFERLKEFAAEKAARGYTQDEIDMYEQYKYDMNEQRPGMPIMEIDDFLQMELGAARLGVANGGRIGFESGDYVGSRKNETLDQEYDSYVKEIDLTGEGKPMSFKSFKKMIDQDYKKGGKVIKIMPEGVLYKGKAKDYPGIKQLIKDMKKKGTRPKKAEGGLMDMGGRELDLRGGGFVPMGKKERADDVPARLSKNEFVMTADAVRAAGGGSVQKGADLMYDTMKKLEAQS
jgi:hypothetical protein